MNEERVDQILLSLKKLDYLNRSQIQRLHNLGSDRNANRILKNLDIYLNHIDEKEHIYYLNKEGRERIGCEKIHRKTNRTKHYIMRNDLYIAMGRPTSWQNEMEVQIPKSKNKFIADAIFKNDKLNFVEVDNTQKMIKNQAKVKKYRELRAYTDFRLIWTTTTQYRKKRLEKMCEGLDVEVYLEGELQ